MTSSLPSSPARPSRCALNGEPVPWEACQTINGSWGYHRDNHAGKTPDMLIRMLVDAVTKGGNLLFNVGPTGRGEHRPSHSRRRWRRMGEWMRRHERSIYGAGPSAHVPPADCRYTQHGDRLYLHLFSWPIGTSICPGSPAKWVTRRCSTMLRRSRSNDRSRHSCHQHDDGWTVPAGTLTLTLPVRQTGVAVPWLSCSSPNEHAFVARPAGPPRAGRSEPRQPLPRDV